MTWIILAAMTIIVASYIVAPLMQATLPAEPGEAGDLHQVRQQLARLDDDLAAGRLAGPVAEETRKALQRRVLAILDADKTAPRADNLRLFQLAIPLALVVAGLGLYIQLGTPDFASREATGSQSASLDALEAQSLPDLVRDLEQRLAQDPNPPFEGYVLLARSRMTLGEFEAAFAAYQTAFDLSDQNPAVAEELQRARAYAAGQLPQIDEATRAAVEDMSPEDREAMINGMVERLATRLESAPDDVDGWIRLLQARLVLGQVDQAQADLAAAITGLQDDPGKQDILRRAATEMGLQVSADDAGQGATEN